MQIVNRRNLLKSACAVLPVMALGGISRSAAQQGENSPASNEQPTQKLAEAPRLVGWHLGPQAWSWRLFTFEEAVQKARQIGCAYIEAGTGIKISESAGERKYGFEMSAADRKLVRQILRDNHVALSASAVNSAGKNGWKSLFDFAAEMAIPVVGIEPPFNQLAEIDKLAQEYRISVGLHNHPQPSIYWDFQTVREHLADCSTWLGAYADTGHWMRSGINPLTAMQALTGRIVGIHLKDLNELGKPLAHDVIWGSGQADIAAIMDEMWRQKYRGPVSIEYETKWENNLDDMAQCAQFFCEKTRALMEEE